MTAAAILRDSASEGVSLSLSATGTIKVTGEQAAVARWLTTIKENKAGIVALLVETASEKPFEASCWLIHFADRNPLEVAFSPAATHAEVLAWYEDAVAAEPVAPIVRQPSDTLSAEEERAVLRWLAHIGEQDPATIAEVLSACRRDIEARRYFLQRAEWRPTHTNIADCTSCRHRRSPGGVVRYCASGRSDLLLAYGAGHPLRRLPDDQGHRCNQWSGLIQRGVE